jgi:anti-anti-sigma factor
MFTYYFPQWFARPAKYPAPGERPQVVAPALPAPRVSRPAAAAPAVEVAVSQTADGLVIRVKGEARVDCAGALLAGLLAPAARRPPVVTLDLSELRSISSLAMGVLVAYRRGVVRAGGRVRLAEDLQPAVREALARAELFDLFETCAAAGAAPAHQAGPAVGIEAV